MKVLDYTCLRVSLFRRRLNSGLSASPSIEYRPSSREQREELLYRWLARYRKSAFFWKDSPIRENRFGCLTSYGLLSFLSFRLEYTDCFIAHTCFTYW